MDKEKQPWVSVRVKTIREYIKQRDDLHVEKEQLKKQVQEEINCKSSLRRDLEQWVESYLHIQKQRNKLESELERIKKRIKEHIINADQRSKVGKLVRLCLKDVLEDKQ